MGDVAGLQLSNEQFESLLRKRFKRSSNDSDDEDDLMELCAGEKVASKLARSADLAFRKGRLVQLGALRRPTDIKYAYGSESFSVSVNLSGKLRSQISLSNPTTWDDFSLLFARLICGYATHFPLRHEELLSYFERLAQIVVLKVASVEAVIEYDRRVRSAHRESWDWLQFDPQAFEVAKCQFPRFPPLGGSGSKPRSRSFAPQDKVNRVCRDWVRGGQSECAKNRNFCKFAHQCLNPKCVEKGAVDHKPDTGKCA